MAERRGTRCAVCTGCGRCFADPAEGASTAWRGERCAVCVGCGRCLEAWGLAPGSGADAESGPTDWAAAFKALDAGTAAPPPPVPGAPGEPARTDAEPDGDAAPDAVTGATPGVATACRELGLDDMEFLNRSLGIKPPGVA